MINFIKGYYLNKNIDINNLYKFITEYCELCKRPIQNTEQIQMIIQLIQMDMFSLNYAIDNYIRLKNINIIKIYDQNNKLINIYIN